MPECARCHDFTDNPIDGNYLYCNDNLDQFAEIEQRGLVVEHDTDGDSQATVTVGDEAVDGGKERSQIDVLARGETHRRRNGAPGTVHKQPNRFPGFVTNICKLIPISDSRFTGGCGGCLTTRQRGSLTEHGTFCNRNG